MTGALTIPKLPKDMPSITRAKLPPSYEAAKMALVKCEKLDECKTWADKMKALASYAKQSKDRTLEIAAEKIRARAIQRAGSIIDSLPKAKPPGKKKKAGTGPYLSPRHQAVEDAGMSPREAKTAVRVARVPEEEFAEAVENDDPATVEELAEMGTKKRPKHLDGVDPKDYEAATRAMARVRDLADIADEMEPDVIKRGAKSFEHEKLKPRLRKIVEWATRLLGELEDT